MGQPITYNFAGIEGHATAIHGAVGIQAGLLDEGKGSLARLAGAWQGDAQGAYNTLMMRWDQTSSELNLALQNLAQAIHEAGATMGQTEAANTARFF